MTKIKKEKAGLRLNISAFLQHISTGSRFFPPAILLRPGLCSLVPLQLSNDVSSHAEMHCFRGARPHGIQYYFIGMAPALFIRHLWIRVPLFVNAQQYADIAGRKLFLRVLCALENRREKISHESRTNEMDGCSRMDSSAPSDYLGNCSIDFYIWRLIDPQRSKGV